MEILIYLGLFLLGLCLGSFGNVVISRFQTELSVVKPRSRCPRCHKPIAWFDNIPVLSWIILQARCRACHEKISIQYPAVELLTGLLFVAIYYQIGLTWTLLEFCIFAWMLIVASVIDLYHRLLPDYLTLTGIALGLLGAALNPHRIFLDAFIGVIGGGGFLWLVAFVYSAIRHEEGMGGGDIKLIAWIGAVLGWRATIFSILVSSVVGSIVGLSLAFTKKSGLKTALPFGPFLAFAALLYIFVGAPSMRAYLAIFFPFAE